MLWRVAGGSSMLQLVLAAAAPASWSAHRLHHPVGPCLAGDVHALQLRRQRRRLGRQFPCLPPALRQLAFQPRILRRHLRQHRAQAVQLLLLGALGDLFQNESLVFRIFRYQ